MSLTLRRERTWLRSSARVMSTTVELMVDGDAALVPRAFTRMRELERRLSRFDPASELNELQARAGEWVTVTDDLFRAIAWSVRLHHETGGLFDPTIRGALEAWGYDRTFAEIATDGPIPAHLPGTGPSILDVELDRDGRRVLLPRGIRIDLGGVGKGLAAEIVAQELVRWGAGGAYVSAGGDIHVSGACPDDGWNVWLEHPDVSGIVAAHRMVDGGLVMSSTTVRRWRRGGHDVHHLIDPRTQAPADTDLIAVAVAAPSSPRAEGLAKAALIAGSTAGRTLLRDAQVDAWLIRTDSTEVVTS